MITTASQVTKDVYGICSVCEQYRAIFHQYKLPRSGRVLVIYCYDCFE